MLILKPQGRGNWSPVTMTLQGRHLSPLLVQAGATVPLGGITFRVCAVHANDSQPGRKATIHQEKP